MLQILNKITDSNLLCFLTVQNNIDRLVFADDNTGGIINIFMTGQIKHLDDKYNGTSDSHRHTLESWTGPVFSLFFFFSFFFFILFSFFLFYKTRTLMLTHSEGQKGNPQVALNTPASQDCCYCLPLPLLNKYYLKYMESNAVGLAALGILRNRNGLIPDFLSFNVTSIYKIAEQKVLIKWQITTAGVYYSLSLTINSFF